jgi:hypothetical protein
MDLVSLELTHVFSIKAAEDRSSACLTLLDKRQHSSTEQIPAVVFIITLVVGWVGKETRTPDPGMYATMCRPCGWPGHAASSRGTAE